METIVALPPYDYEADRRKPMPSKNHAIIQMRISGSLFSRYSSRFTILPEIRVEINDAAYTPDICIYPLLTFDSRQDEVRMTELPLTAVDILSPTQAVDELMAKFEVYFKAGVGSGWLVQPSLQTIFLLTPDGKIVPFHNETLIDPTTGVELNLTEVFQ
ncbi:Uma2 family endonuclease [Fibrella arboris]|uniref:Uma2 family endonuclease n=1 Tax=Fibrella arboris TaxID=3242486 RepID=UPI00352125C2